MIQQFVSQSDYKNEIIAILKQNHAKNILLVCGHSMEQLKLNQLFDELPAILDVTITRFMNFEPNPRYESTVAGVKVFQEHACDFIIAVGGGSALDVAKCIKLFHTMDESKDYIGQKIIPNATKLLAIPTTAGTGSESTKFSIIYVNGEKQSINEESSLPDYVLLLPEVLETLPNYQRKATMMDALCHAIESYWSVKSQEESKHYAKAAMLKIMQYKDAYLENEGEGNLQMLEAANLAGQAINLTQTTAAHAMCYKITTYYGIAHGHAAMLCLTKIWCDMLQHMDICNDPRGSAYVKRTFQEIAHGLGYATVEEALDKLEQLMEELGLQAPKSASRKDRDMLVKSVNVQKLNNNPIGLNEQDLVRIYDQIFNFI
ncbi:MAG: phosphonoacetaldehyde reductase [Velocimicrobium sp.]